MKKETGVYSIRPAARHILTIGRDLIQDHIAAIIELVKNAYDADSPDVNISISISPEREKLTIIFEDHGHGMSMDTVINKWLVPSTDDKLKRRISPGGRTMQGRKGIGRYAASILGKDLLLKTVTPGGEKTELYLEWASFEKFDYLDEVEIIVDTEQTGEKAGTQINITGDKTYANVWDEEQINKLRYELSKLISPVRKDDLRKDDFIITIYVEGCGEKVNGKHKIEPLPLFEQYDYRISGKIEENGKGTLVYENHKVKNTIDETINFDLEDKTDCGELIYDIKVYDREKDAIEQTIRRGQGLMDYKGNYMSNLEYRRLLNELNGIGVYRHDFRLRPLGDPGFDWLELNKRRFQNPTMCISSNQTVGYVAIHEEELSGLEEKSARDGLKENKAYDALKSITHKVISELETRRCQYRRKEGLSRPAVKIERELEKLFTFDDVKTDVITRLNRSGVDSKITDEVIKIIDEKEEKNNRIVEDIRNVVAVYQGQATLGKIINVILHEARQPLTSINERMTGIKYWSDKLLKSQDLQILLKIIPAIDALKNSSDVFVGLFRRLDPLAAKKREQRKKFNLFDTLEGTFKIFEKELIDNGIKYKINCEHSVSMYGWSQDIYVIIANLIDNSIYWMTEKKSQKKFIQVNVDSIEDNVSHIDYLDTGPGIEEHLIESEIIFEPEFSTKPGGTGLGLAIAGEAATRNGLKLKVFSSDTGSYFRLEAVVEE